MKLILLSACRSVLTGSYNNYFHIYDRNTKDDILLQADKSAFKAKKVGSTKNRGVGFNKKARADDPANGEAADFSKKILHMSWHPQENTIALAATNNLFLFQRA